MYAAISAVVGRHSLWTMARVFGHAGLAARVAWELEIRVRSVGREGGIACQGAEGHSYDIIRMLCHGLCVEIYREGKMQCSVSMYIFVIMKLGIKKRRWAAWRLCRAIWG